jgi:hypothetical protein
MENSWKIVDRRGQDRGIHRLQLEWWVNYESITDDFYQSEISAQELMRMWLKRMGEEEDVKISWMVDSVSESAPFTGEDEDFLSFYQWPTHAVTGERLNWLTLPVQDKAWNENQADKGGFFQEVLGWKPSPLQRTLHLPTLLSASGWQ